MTHAYYVAFRKTLLEMMRLPHTSVAATQIDRLIKDVAEAGAAKSVIEALVRDTHTEMSAIHDLCWTPYAAVAGSLLENVYQRLCHEVKCVDNDHTVVINGGSQVDARPPIRATAYLSFHETIIRFQQTPSTAGPASRILRLLERLAVAGVPATVLEDLVRECDAQVATIDGLAPESSGVAANRDLQFAYERLCENIRLHHPNYNDLIQASPKVRAGVRGVQTDSSNRTNGLGDASSSVVDPVMRFENAVAQFTEGTRLRPSSKSVYRCHVVGYLRWLDKEGIVMRDVTSRDIDRFLETKYTIESSRTACLCAIRRFHEALLGADVLSANPADHAGRSRRERPSRRNVRRRRQLRDREPS